MRRPVSFRLEPVAGPAPFSLRLVIDPVPAGRWLFLTYASNLYEAPRRPLLRFGGAEGAPDAVMPGPVLGRARWLGPVPPGTTELLIAPPGEASGFRLERAETATTAGMFGLCLRRRPSRLPQALLLALKGEGRRCRNVLRGACAAVPRRGWTRWARERRRSLEPGFDRPLGPAEPESTILLVLVGQGDASRLARTIASVRGQGHRTWRLLVAGPTSLPDDARIGRLPWRDERSVVSLLEGEFAERPVAVGLLEPGDVLAPDALALAADAFAARPSVQLVYADTELGSGGGARPRPKPDWSPDRALSVDDLDGLTLMTPSLMGRLGMEEAGPPAGAAMRLRRAAARAVAPGEVLHLPRVLCRVAQAPARVDAPQWARPAGPPLVSVVIPSRDRVDLIEPCLRGLLDRTDYPALEVVVVDNGSTDPAVLALYGGLRTEGRVAILPWPAPFDFSAMTNDGVAASRGEIVLLLNNDTRVRHPDWLDAMVRQAARPEVGAVGAKLLHHDGRLQHAGVVVGLGGFAGHLLRRRPADIPGDLDRLRVVHEVSAVTAACLAVSRAKFDAVGGLDRQAFPIDFNDVDFCLRLGRAGWKTVWTPHAVLDHLESVSRGPPRGADRVRFEAEAARFAARWGEVIRHDPYYHPALSLTTFGEELE